MLAEATIWAKIKQWVGIFRQPLGRVLPAFFLWFWCGTLFCPAQSGEGQVVANVREVVPAGSTDSPCYCNAPPFCYAEDSAQFGLNPRFRQAAPGVYKTVEKMPVLITRAEDGSPRIELTADEADKPFCIKLSAVVDTTGRLVRVCVAQKSLFQNYETIALAHARENIRYQPGRIGTRVVKVQMDIPVYFKAGMQPPPEEKPKDGKPPTEEGKP